MNASKLRRRIAWKAARLVYEQRESDVYAATMRAARRLCRGWVDAADLPDEKEIRELIQSLSRQQAESLDSSIFENARLAEGRDRFDLYESLLAPLEFVKLNRWRHPEGDALYHSLQVFDLARNELPYDEEFLLAALLHDVGRAIDPRDHVAAALESLQDFVTKRTAWMIEHHTLARQCLDHTIGVRARRRLAAHESYEELLLLAECDAAGRVAGAPAPELDEALRYIRDLAETSGE